MIRNRKVLIPFFVLTTTALGCGLFSDKDSVDKAVVPATEFGTPTGEKVTSNIGPAGGRLVSPDGRITLTVPPNALSSPVAFSIQPITDTSPGGLGHGYRLAPDGVAFAVPVNVSFTFDGQDWPGEISDDVDIAFQAKDGTWQIFESVVRDQASRSLTVSTTHFSDYTAVYPWKLVPNAARVHVGKEIALNLYYCGRRRSAIDKLLSLSEECLSADGRRTVHNWYVNDVADGNAVLGTTYEGNDETTSGGTYVAPAKRPSPSSVIVRGDVDHKFDYYLSTHPTHWVFANIEIFDTAYKVSGSAGADTILNGRICDLEKPFAIKTSNPFIESVEFDPSSSTSGSWGMVCKNGLRCGGGGQYTIEGSDTEKTGILMNSSVTGRLVFAEGAGAGAGDVHLVLTPLTGNECG